MLYPSELQHFDEIAWRDGKQNMHKLHWTYCWHGWSFLANSGWISTFFQSFCCFALRFSIWFAFICEQLAWTPKHQTLLPGQSLRRPTRRRDPALSQRCSWFFRKEVGLGWSVGIPLMEEMLLTSGYGNFPHLFTGLHTGAGGFLLSTIPFPFTTHSPTRYYPCIVHVLASKTSWWNVGGSSSQVMKQVWNHQEDTYSWLFMVQWTMGCLQNDLRFARVGSSFSTGEGVWTIPCLTNIYICYSLYNWCDEYFHINSKHAHQL